MEIKLEHGFTHKCHDLHGLLDGCQKLNTYTNRLANQSMLHPDRYDPERYKGDGLELLVEALIKLSPVDNRIGVTDYHPILEATEVKDNIGITDYHPLEDGVDIDTGVDGYGVGIDGKPATVQVKYRHNQATMLTANKDMLGNFVAASLLKHKVDPESKVSMFVFTTANGLHHFTDNEMYENKVKCIGYDQLRDLIDNNMSFWNTFRELLNINY